MIELLKEYQWLVGLLIGFFLNQIAFVISRYLKKKDMKNDFKKKILFMKCQLNYVSDEIEKIPVFNYFEENSKDPYLLQLRTLRDELRLIQTNAIPDSLVGEVATVTNHLNFFINSLEKSSSNKRLFESPVSLQVAIGTAEDFKATVKRIFKSLDIEYNDED